MRILDKKALREKVPYSDAQIWRLEKAGRFPRRVSLGDNRVGWLESEIDDWIEARVAARDAAADTPAVA